MDFAAIWRCWAIESAIRWREFIRSFSVVAGVVSRMPSSVGFPACLVGSGVGLRSSSASENEDVDGGEFAGGVGDGVDES